MISKKNEEDKKTVRCTATTTVAIVEKTTGDPLRRVPDSTV